MTRFCGDAVGVRTKGGSAYTSKDLKKNMQKFLETGVHPDVEKARAKAAAGAIPSLPDHDANRDFVFLDLSYGPKPLGRLVIELYRDLVPVGADLLRNRCLPGSKAGLQGTCAHKLQAGFAVWIGKNPAAGEGMRMPQLQRLRHVDKGAVSVSLNGDEVVICLGRALPLDSSHLVVGRVHKGIDVLDTVSDLPTNHNDLPQQKLVVTKCGPTNPSGVHEELGGEGEGAPKQSLATRLAEASADARDSVKQALAEALQQQKRPRDSSSEPGAAQDGTEAPGKHSASGSGTAAAAAAGGGAGSQGAQAGGGSGSKGGGQGGTRNVRAKYMDDMLGVSDVDDSDEEGEEGG